VGASNNEGSAAGGLRPSRRVAPQSARVGGDRDVDDRGEEQRQQHRAGEAADDDGSERAGGLGACVEGERGSMPAIIAPPGWY
jgi:hypothetical protein